MEFGSIKQGTTLEGRYQIQGNKPIGRGGFSQVWKAIDLEDVDQRAVAIKIISGLEEENRDLLRQEYEITQKWAHPNLVATLDYFEYRQYPCLVMEYVGGGSLYQKMDSMWKQKAIFSEQTIAKVICDIGKGLAYLHEKRVLHSDIKPDNILISESGVYKLTDFGISIELRNTLLRHSQQKGTTIAYRTPEDYLKQDISQAADIFQLGLVLYEMSTGEDLVRMNELIGMKIAYLDYQPKIDADHYSGRCLQLILKCLSKAVSDRPTAEALALHGDHFLKHQYWSVIEEGRSRATERIPVPPATEPQAPPEVPAPPKPKARRRKRNLKPLYRIMGIGVVCISLFFGGQALREQLFSRKMAEAAGYEASENWLAARRSYEQAIKWKQGDSTATQQLITVKEAGARYLEVALEEIEAAIGSGSYTEAETLIDYLSDYPNFVPMEKIEALEAALRQQVLIDRARELVRTAAYDEALRTLDEALVWGADPDIDLLRGQIQAAEAEEQASAMNQLLIAACEAGDAGGISAAIRGGADPNLVYRGAPALYHAIKSGQFDAVSALLQGGARVEAGGSITYGDQEYGSVVALATVVGNPSILRAILIKAPDAANRPLGRTLPAKYPLGLSILAGQYEAAAILVEQSADLSVGQTGEEDPALLLAILKRQNRMVDLFLEKGADPNQGNRKGIRPLMAAAAQGDTLILERLLEAGATLDLRDRQGKDAYAYAAEATVKAYLARRGGGRLQIAEDFASNRSQYFSALQEPGITYAFENDRFVLKSTDNRSFSKSVNFNIDLSRDFEYELTGRLGAHEGSIIFGVLFGGDGSSSYRFYLNQNGQYALKGYNGQTGRWEPEIVPFTALAGWDPAGAITLRVRRSNGAVTIALNGRQLHTFTAPTFFGNHLGVVVGGNCTFSVDQYALSGRRRN